MNDVHQIRMEEEKQLAYNYHHQNNIVDHDGGDLYG